MPVRENTPQEAAEVRARREAREAAAERDRLLAEGVLADPCVAVAAYLKTQMGERVNHVLTPELSESLDPAMPTSALVISPAGQGKLMAGNRLPLLDSLVDILAYGTVRSEADSLARDVQALMRQFAMVRSEGVLLYWARKASGILPRVEPDVEWPYSEQTHQVLHSEYVLS